MGGSYTSDSSVESKLTWPARFCFVRRRSGVSVRPIPDDFPEPT
jgi:hypothetical protein